jgi:hypothetical protein
MFTIRREPCACRIDLCGTIPFRYDRPIPNLDQGYNASVLSSLRYRYGVVGRNDINRLWWKNCTTTTRSRSCAAQYPETGIEGVRCP